MMISGFIFTLLAIGIAFLIFIVGSMVILFGGSSRRLEAYKEKESMRLRRLESIAASKTVRGGGYR